MLNNFARTRATDIPFSSDFDFKSNDRISLGPPYAQALLHARIARRTEYLRQSDAAMYSSGDYRAARKRSELEDMNASLAAKAQQRKAEEASSNHWCVTMSCFIVILSSITSFLKTNDDDA